MAFERYPVRRLEESPVAPLDRLSWPGTLTPVAQLLDHGLDLGPVTVLVGENGSGKSTLVEAVALAYGMSPEGGSTGARHSTRASESGLGEHLRIVRHPGASRRGYFLRAETMHGFFTYLESNPAWGGPEVPFHEMSHGESFLELIVDRFKKSGLWVLDEPESALSFAGCLSLLSVLKALVAKGDSQVLISTHSPLLAAMPGATIYEVGDWGLRRREWADLDLVSSWQRFLAAPEQYLRHL